MTTARADKWSRTEIGYCANVYPTSTFAELLVNIQSKFDGVRQTLNLSELAYGFWSPNQIIEELLTDNNTSKLLLNTISKHKALIQTCNGFPMINFHQEIVKSHVYTPSWAENSRLDYTKKLALLLSKLLPISTKSASISTVPLGYSKGWTKEKSIIACQNLANMASFLEEIEDSSGIRITLALEMEPDCALESTKQTIDFFSELSAAYPGPRIRRYIGICYDVCHQAVMHENTTDSLTNILAADITIGKIQISNALKINPLNNDREHLEHALGYILDKKFLHQVISSENGTVYRHADLDYFTMQEILDSKREWRVHYHVPVNMSALKIDEITFSTTQDDIINVLRFLSCNNIKPDIEIETYTWPQLLSNTRTNNQQIVDLSLQNAICDEISWLHKHMNDFELLKD